MPVVTTDRAHRQTRIAHGSSSLVQLPPELLNAIAVHLPLSALNNLIASSPKHFQELHGLTIRSPSFAPWRRRYEAHRRAYQSAFKAAELRAYQRRINRTDEPPIDKPDHTQEEYQAVVNGFLADLGFSEPESTGIVAVTRSRVLIMGQKELLMSIKRMWSGKEKKVLRLRKLPCELVDLKTQLNSICEWDRLKPFISPIPENEVAATYYLLTVYLLYSSLTPEDLPELLATAANLWRWRDEKEDGMAAICEYFCYLALFLDIWEAQEGNLDIQTPEDAYDPGGVYEVNFRRVLNCRLRNWLDKRFAPAKPEFPNALATPNPQPAPIPAPSQGRRGTLARRAVTLSGVSPFQNSSAAGMSSAPPTRGTGMPRRLSWNDDSVVPITGSLPLFGYSAARTSVVKDSLTEEQQRIVDTDLRSGEIMKVRAFAGTGKTRSLVEYAKRRPRKRFLYVAFNKNARVDAEKKFGMNVDCKTIHAVALRELENASYVVWIAKKDNRMPLPEYWGTKDIIQYFDLEKDHVIYDALQRPDEHLAPRARKNREECTPGSKLPFPTPTSVATVIKLGIEKFWNSAWSVVEEKCLPKYMIEHLGLKPKVILGWVQHMWNQTIQGTAPWLPHDAYLKLMQLTESADEQAFGKYDVIMFDEAQDSTPCMSSLVLRQAINGRAIVIVGDPYQKIYGFRGAGNDCFNDEQFPPTYTNYLTHSFRFGDNIASVANVLLRALKEPQSVHGVRRKDTVHRAVRNTSLFAPSEPPTEPGPCYTIIFRKNATLISHAISFALSHPLHKLYLHLQRGFAKRILFTTLRSAFALYHHSTRATSGVLSEWRTWSDLKTHVEAAKEGEDLPPLLTLCVALEEKLATTDFLSHLRVLEQNVLDEAQKDDADVIFITAHQAKGLEWDRVHVTANDFGPPYNRRISLCKTAYWREEAGLLYVAVTRAKMELIVGAPVLQWIASESGVARAWVSGSRDHGSCESCGDTDAVFGVEDVSLPVGRFEGEVRADDARQKWTICASCSGVVEGMQRTMAAKEAVRWVAVKAWDTAWRGRYSKESRRVEDWIEDSLDLMYE